MTRADHREEVSRIRDRFDAAEDYDQGAAVQRLTAARLMRRIEAMFPGRGPARILEFGCGTGALTALLQRRWPQAELIATDIAPAMLERARMQCGDRVRYELLDITAPAALSGTFDLICGSLALQWVADDERDQVLRQLARKLAPSGVLAVSTLTAGSFAEWRQAHERAGEVAAIRRYPSLRVLQTGWPRKVPDGTIPLCCAAQWVGETILEETGSSLGFLRNLRRTGATLPREGSQPLSVSAMRQVLRNFDEAGAAVSWEIAYGLFRRSGRDGVFVTGTGTGVGKTFTSACLTRAWNAVYWKPLQTGLSEEDGDTPEIARLSGVTGEQILPPGETFLAPLSPEAAARLEGRTVDPARFTLPGNCPEKPLVAEGAGGVLVPLTAARNGVPGVMIADLIARLHLPVVVVADSELGTINHTLLSVEALRRRGLVVAGVVLNGPRNEGNRQAVEEHGQVRILAELPRMPEVTPETVAQASACVPPFRTEAG